MNNRFIKIIALIASSAIFISGCSETKAFKSSDTDTDNPSNDNVISQNNFTIRADPVNPAFFDPATGNYTTVTSEISVQIGDNNNQLITDSRVIHFRTEWGLIDPSCSTDENGTCSVTWRSGSPDTAPANMLNNIVAYSNGGQESFLDENGNGFFDDGDTWNNIFYQDVQEPFVNVDDSYSASGPTFTPGDIVIDTVNGRDLGGDNEIHDDGDTFFNGPGCAHATLCSPVIPEVTVWESFSQLLNGGTFYSVGGGVSGLTAGTLIIQNNGGNDISITTNGPYSYTIVGGSSYNITVKTQPSPLVCTVINATGTPTADVTDVNISCS
jgi:hypothetical protein